MTYFASKGDPLNALYHRFAIDLDGAIREWIGAIDVALTCYRDIEHRLGEAVAIPPAPEPTVCAVAAVRWIKEARLESGGSLFWSFALPRGRNAPRVLQACRLGDRDVARVVQQAVTAAGLEGDFAAHSLRAGFITSAAVRGVAEVNIQRVSRHKSTAVLRAYVRHATRFDEAPLSEILRTGVRSQNLNGMP